MTTPNTTLTFDPHEALLRSQIPLKEFREILRRQDESKVTRIDFSRNGYYNDAVLKLIQQEKKKDYVNLKEVLLDGCILITNSGIKWLTEIIHGATELQKLVLDGCSNLGDSELYLLSKEIGKSCEIDMRGTAIRLISEIEMDKVKVTCNPVKEREDFNQAHVFIFPHESMQTSLCHFIKYKKTVKRDNFHNLTEIQIDQWNFTATETNLDHPLFDVMLGVNPVQVVIPFDESANDKEVQKHMKDTVVKVISKSSFTSSFTSGKQKLQILSNTPFIFGTVRIKLLRLAHKLDITKEMFTIFNDMGVRQGHLECYIQLCKDNGDPMDDQEPLKDSKQLLSEQLRFKVVINFATGLPKDIESSYCKFKFHHVSGSWFQTSEQPGSSPNFQFQQLFYVRSVKQRLLGFLEKASLSIDVWARKKTDVGLVDELEAPKEQVGDAPKSVVPPKEADINEEIANYRPCEFVMIANGKNAEKLEKFKLKPDHFNGTLEEIDSCITDLEGNFPDLDIQGQSVYASLWKTKEKIQDFCRQLDKVHYMSVDLASDEGAKAVKLKMSQIMDYHKKHMSVKYRECKRNMTIMNTIVQIVQEEKIVDFDTTGNFGQKEVDLRINGQETIQLVDSLHEQGRLAVISVGSRSVIADIDFLQSLLIKLKDFSTMEPCQKMSTAVGEASKVWTVESMENHLFFENSEIQKDLLQTVLHEYLGLMEVPAWRFKTEDPQFLYVVPESLTSPPMALRDFWREEKESKDFVIMRQTYRFICPVSIGLLAGIQSLGTNYGRTILLTPEGAVFQIGSVQTVIRKEKEQTGCDIIIVESKSYLPEKRTEPVNSTTEFYVQQNTWNIFCLYTDTIDKILKQSNVIYLLSREVPNGLVNMSIGCKHDWKSRKKNHEDQLQSVCTLCNKCCDKGRKCPYNGMMGNYFKECLCKTSFTGCEDCGICMDCASYLWEVRSYLRPLPTTFSMDSKDLKKTEKLGEKSQNEEENRVEMDEEGKTENQEDNPFHDLAMNADLLQDEDEQEGNTNKSCYIQVPLDPFTFNEVEVEHVSDGNIGVVLREIDRGTRILVYPGKATEILSDDSNRDESITDKIRKLCYSVTSFRYKFIPGDNIKIRITDPFRTIARDKSLESRYNKQDVVYRPAVFTNVLISHETGFLCYHNSKTKPGKAYFVGARPFTEKFNSFSIKIINCGQSKFIGMGVSANKAFGLHNQTGRDIKKADFIKYYINKGGFYTQRSGFAQKDGSNEGDILTIVCDVVNKKLKFLRNNEEFFQCDIEIPEGGYYPQISMHSEGECVQLMEELPWRPDPMKKIPDPPAFDTYKYSNLWISPAATVVMTSKKVKTEKASEFYVFGYVLLHNPLDQQLACVIHPHNTASEPFVSIEPGESKCITLSSQIRGKGSNILETGVRVVWTVLDLRKDLNVKDIKKLIEKAVSSNTFQHRLNCVTQSDNEDETGELSLFNDLVDTDGDSYKLEVFKKLRMSNSYCLKKGNYVLEFYNLNKGKEAVYQVKRPKCPSFLYSPSVQIGMKCIVKLQRYLTQDEYTDGVIIEEHDRGRFALECRPKGETTANDRIIRNQTAIGIEDLEFEKINRYIQACKIYPYAARYQTALVNKSYVPAPPHLITKGSACLREVLEPDWITETLQLFSLCSQVITRPTVQEKTITEHSRTLLAWHKLRETNLPPAVFLPKKLDSVEMMFPSLSNMFADVNLHRLCFFNEKFLYDLYKEKGIERSRQNINSRSLKVKYGHRKTVNYSYLNISDKNGLMTSHNWSNSKVVNLHFMDIEPNALKRAVPLDASFGCMYQSWLYIALLANQLMVPSYSKMLPGDLGDLQKQQIERLLFQIIQSYASLCGIYATQYGGLSQQKNMRKLDRKLTSLCEKPLIPTASKFVTKQKMTDDHLFWVVEQERDSYMCKAHYNSCIAENLSNGPSDMSLEKNYFFPYSENLDTLFINEQRIRSVPSDMFQTFKNLQVFSMVDVVMTESSLFPSGISECPKLEIVVISGIEGLTGFSKDILLGPALGIFYLHNTPVKTLEIDWPTGSLLSKLSLVGILLEEVPKGVSQLHNLQELILDYNPICDLPDDLKNLKKLRTLSVKGIPWINIDDKSTLPKVVFEQWHKDNPYILNYLTHETVDQLFSKFDINSNNVLDPTELANLNMYFMMKIPRIGLHPGSPNFGAVPPVIFKMKNLQNLNLSYSAITDIGDKVKNLHKLHLLDLEHCPILDNLSGQLGLLPHLRSMHLNGCPLLETPPLDIVGRGFDAVKAFLKRIAGGFTECHRTKLMFIGLGQAGKTTLLEALRSDKKMAKAGEDTKLTDGIEIKPWIVPVNYGERQIEITYSCWDFAGQTVYYNTHQFFLSKQAVYMLLWNMRMGFEHAGLDFWLSSIACHCPEAPVIVVGTQLDQIPMPDIPEADLMEKYPQIKSFCYVSSTQGMNIRKLERTLVEVTMDHCTQMQVKIPKVWLSFENSILKKREIGRNIMEWSGIKECAISNGLYEEKDIRLAIQFLNDLGTVQYFDTDFLRDRVVINPQWIVDVMAKVVSVNEKSIKENKGRFYHRYIPEIWSDYDPSLHQWMLKLTERFDLTFPLPEEIEKFNIVPCLLPETKPKNLPWPYLSEDEGVRESTILYKFAYLPTGLFNRAQARLFSQGFTDKELFDYMWKKGSILRKNQHYALVKQVNDYEMIVSVQGPRPKNVLDLIHETISTLIKDSFVGVDYDYYVQCPDCVDKEGTKDPFLFQAELIHRAYSVNAPFLQCTKFFHTVSIGELLRIMPESKETEFDAQMQESISTLEEISSNMATEVAILYCPEDLPKNPVKPNLKDEIAAKIPVDPRKIHEDLMKAGYSCWFPLDISKTPELEMTLAVKNSKVLVVCMSENFVRDQKCHQMFLYATEQLHKPFAVAVISESLEWQQTDIGFKIGNPKMAMMKNMKRYPEKVKDLVDIVKTFIDDLEKMKMSTPSVFVSYCWANSKEACSITTQPRPGSLGYGDPRALKKYLENDGIRCWIDFEQMGKFGLYQDITVGLQNCRVLVICVSDEYLESDACMMEARFGVYNLLLPVVVCVVGTGTAWKESEVNLMVQRQGELAKIVKMQKETSDAYSTVLSHVKNFLKRPETEKQRKIRERLEKARHKIERLRSVDLDLKLKQQGDTEFSYQEEIELIQRKFMRYITKLSLMEDTQLPRLLVIDFSEEKQETDTSLLKEVQASNLEYNQELPAAIDDLTKANQSKAQTLLQTLISRVDQPSKDEEKDHGITESSQIQGMMDMLNECIEEKWEGKDLNLRVMCEYDQGWHFYGVPLSLDKIVAGSDSVSKLLSEAAPYLARVYTILKQSGVELNSASCMTGEVFLSYIRKAGSGTKNFTDAYRMLCKTVAGYLEQDKWWSYDFPRCCLPNGKVAYLCEEHMNKVGATIIQYNSDSTGPSRVILSEQDKLLREILSENSTIKKMKTNRENLTPRPDHKPKKEKDEKMEKSEEVNTVESKQTETNAKENPKTPETVSSSLSDSASSQSFKRKKSQRRTSQACSLQ